MSLEKNLNKDLEMVKTVWNGKRTHWQNGIVKSVNEFSGKKEDIKKEAYRWFTYTNSKISFSEESFHSHYCKLSHLTNWFFSNVSLETFYMRNAKFKYKQILAMLLI